MLTRSYKFAALFLIVALGLALRLRGLDRVGFNEDEFHKVEAARAYLRGNFLVNLELEAGTRLLAQREMELVALTGPEVKRVLAAKNVQLVNHSAFVASTAVREAAA